MKNTSTFLALTLTLAATLPAQAQLFRPQTVNGAVLGGIAGAIIGNNSGDHNGARGALIGVAAGALLGSAAADDQARRAQVPASVIYAPARPNPVLGPVLLGGIAGAIIGNNSGNHNPWQGAAIGAGAGYILGRLGDNQPRHHGVSTPVYAPVVAPAPVVYASQVAPAPQSVTIINNYYYNTPATPLSDANAMFGR